MVFDWDGGRAADACRPYIPFPEFWPIFTPKDKLGDWFEAYANSLELNVWNEATIGKSSYDDSKKEWSIEVSRPKDGETESRNRFNSKLEHRITDSMKAHSILVSSSKPRVTLARNNFHLISKALTALRAMFYAIRRSTKVLRRMPKARRLL